MFVVGQPDYGGNIMKRINKAIINLLVEHKARHMNDPSEVPQGMNTIQIREALIDKGFSKTIPPNHTLGTTIRRIKGVRAIGTERAGIIYTRNQKIWDVVDE
jgi:hypothetical protein|tara:strand:+ start:590 stop:895 length:306 start_codon:yes stop_codon:yes gene_type:complete